MSFATDAEVEFSFIDHKPHGDGDEDEHFHAGGKGVALGERSRANIAAGIDNIKYLECVFPPICRRCSETPLLQMNQVCFLFFGQTSAFLGAVHVRSFS